MFKPDATSIKTTDIIHIEFPAELAVAYDTCYYIKDMATSVTCTSDSATRVVQITNFPDDDGNGNYTGISTDKTLYIFLKPTSDTITNIVATLYHQSIGASNIKKQSTVTVGSIGTTGTDVFEGPELSLGSLTTPFPMPVQGDYSNLAFKFTPTSNIDESVTGIRDSYIRITLPESGTNTKDFPAANDNYLHCTISGGALSNFVSHKCIMDTTDANWHYVYVYVGDSDSGTDVGLKSGVEYTLTISSYSSTNIGFLMPDDGRYYFIVETF